MHVRSVTAMVSLVWLIAGQDSPGPPAANPAERDLPVSLTRIREALQRPAGLTLPDRKADFYVDIRERQRLTSFLAPIDFTAGTAVSPIPGQRSPGSGGKGMGVTVDPVAVVRAIRKHFAEKAAREEVERVFRELCATHSCAPPEGRSVP